MEDNTKETVTVHVPAKVSVLPVKTIQKINEEDSENMFMSAIKAKEEETFDYHSEKDWSRMTEQKFDRSAARRERQKKAEELLANNPLFKRTCTTLERLEQGKPVLTVDEYKQRYFDLEIDNKTEKVMSEDFTKEVLEKNDSVEDDHAREYAADNPDNIVSYGRVNNLS